MFLRNTLPPTPDMRNLTRSLLLLAQCIAIGLLFVLLGVMPVRAEAEATPTVVINEIHFDPRSAAGGLEYVELYNVGSAQVDLAGWSLAKGIDYVFPAGAVLPPSAYLVVTRDPAALRQAYGVSALGPFAGKLSNDGDELMLRNRNGQLVDAVTYGLGFPWPTPDDNADQSIGLINALLDNAIPGAWRSAAPTPGRQNNGSTENPPPFVADVSHMPVAPRVADVVTVRAHVTDADGVATVRLWLQAVSPGSYIRLTDPQYQSEWTAVPMQSEGNDVYAAQVPAGMRLHRLLVRYRIEAIDNGGRSLVTPYADDPQPNFAFFVYDGVPVWRGAIMPKGPNGKGQYYDYNFGLMRPLPVYHLLARQSDVEDSQFIPNSPLLGGYMGSDYPWLGTLVVNGVVYDHIRFRARGGEYRYSVGKNHWKFDFTRGHGFQGYDDYGQPYPVKWNKLNFSSVFQHAQRGFRGEQGLFESLAYRLFNLAGVPAPETNFVHFRVIDQWDEATSNQYQGDFWGLYLAIENLDGNFLSAHDRPDGNLYDMHDWTGDLDNRGDGGAGDLSDLNAFMSAYIYGQPDPGWWRRTFDLDGYYRFRSILEVVHHYDVDQGKNYYYYLDPTNGKWSIWPWDLDLTWSEKMFGQGGEPFRDRVLSVPEFNIAYQNNLRELRDLLFNTDQMLLMIDETAAIINTPANGLSMVNADRAMWDYNPLLVSRYVSDDRAAVGKFYGSSPDNGFSGMGQLLKEYVARRSAWIDQTLLTDHSYPATPSLSYVGPAGHPADQLQVRASAFDDPQGAGTFAAMQWRAAEVIWPGLPGYTENSRWRYEVQATWLSPVLPSYRAETAVARGACRPGVTCRVRVRMQDSSGRWSHWSPPLEFVAGPPALGPTADLKLSEIMYKPAPSTTLPNQELDFLELTNSGSEAIDLSNMRFSQGIEYQFPAGAQLQPDGHLVLVAHAAYFTARYGFAPFAQYAKELSNQGERLVLLDAFGTPVFDVTYSDGDGWPEAADGGGYSLVALPGDTSLSTGWRASTAVGGSPGVDDPLPVIVNEVQVEPDSGRVTQVELYNPSGQAADVAGWILATTPPDLSQGLYAVPAGWCLPQTDRIAAGGYAVIDMAGANLVLDANAPMIALLSALPDGRRTGYSSQASLSIPLVAATIGRVVTSDGFEHFTAQRAPSWGEANSGPLASAVVLSALAISPNDGVQWLEFTNRGEAAVKLYDPDNLQNRWLLGGAGYLLPAGVELPAGGRLLITSAEPSDLCLSGRVPAWLRVIGPLPLPITAQGTDLMLLMLTRWNGNWAFGEVDGVRYRNQPPWPLLAPNLVLRRIALDGFGDEPANWQAAPANQVSNLDGLPAAAADPAATAQLCSFDAFVNRSGQVEIRWVAAPLGDTTGFRLLRSPLSDLEAKAVVATQMKTDAQGQTPALIQFVDADADPQQQYVYWLQTVAADDSAHDVALTTVRSEVHFAYAPFIGR